MMTAGNRWLDASGGGVATIWFTNELAESTFFAGISQRHSRELVATVCFVCDSFLIDMCQSGSASKLAG